MLMFIYVERYLAAKIYYFGVHGGLRQFEEFVNKTGLFTSQVVHRIHASRNESIANVLPIQCAIIV
jgi:hypothetical protein